MTVPYTPGDPPSEAPQIQAFLRNELSQLKRGLEAAWDYGEQRYLTAQPARIRAGQMVLADGVIWNPGSGEGLYRRDAANASWVFIG